MATRRTKCWRCETPFSDEEREGPRYEQDDKDRDIRSQPICDECFHEHYEFTCCMCANYGDTKDQHNMLVVFEAIDSMGGSERQVQPGVYRIKEGGSYHGGPLIGRGYLFGDRLERINDLRPSMDGEGYPCGHICLDCQAEAAKPITRKERDRWERDDLYKILSEAAGVDDEGIRDAIIRDLGLVASVGGKKDFMYKFHKLPLMKIREVAKKWGDVQKSVGAN